VRRQTLAQREAELGGAGGEVVEVRPRALGVDMVGGQRRHPAPIVRPCLGKKRQLDDVLQVRRYLDPHARAHHEPCHGDGRGVLQELRVGGVLHRRARLRAEVLHDDLLDVAVSFVRFA
jgi:hypothetical protein